MDGFWSSDQYFGFLNTFKYQEERVVLDKYTIIEKNRSRTVFNWFQYFSPETLCSEFKKTGFEVTEWFGDVAGGSFDPVADEFAVVCKKSLPG